MSAAHYNMATRLRRIINRAKNDVATATRMLFMALVAAIGPHEKTLFYTKAVYPMIFVAIGQTNSFGGGDSFMEHAIRTEDDMETLANACSDLFDQIEQIVHDAPIGSTKMKIKTTNTITRAFACLQTPIRSVNPHAEIINVEEEEEEERKEISIDEDKPLSAPVVPAPTTILSLLQASVPMEDIDGQAAAMERASHPVLIGEAAIEEAEAADPYDNAQNFQASFEEIDLPESDHEEDETESQAETRLGNTFITRDDADALRAERGFPPIAGHQSDLPLMDVLVDISLAASAKAVEKKSIEIQLPAAMEEEKPQPKKKQSKASRAPLLASQRSSGRTHKKPERFSPT